MAIKGKKKSQSRGSQARRRPAAAPRAIGPGRKRPSWYKTPQGRAAIIALLIVVAAVITGVVLKARSNSAKLADRQQALETYTGSVRAYLQTITPVATDMTTTPTDAEDFAGLSRLPKRAEEWAKTMEDAVGELVTLRPPPRALLVQGFIEQSSQLYLTSARLFEQMADQPNSTRKEVLAETSTLRDQAGALFINAVALLDEIRADLDMAPSGLRSPSSGPTDVQPSPIETTLEQTGGGGGGGDGGGGGGDKGKKGSNNGSG